MSSFNGNYTIVFNGEIYNHRELRKRLNFTNFKGNSDTETITVCLEEWGIRKTVEALDGMFAIAIYHHSSQNFTLVRDFAGIKPLFYGWDGITLVAGSQYDQIMKHPKYANKDVNPSVLKLYLQQHFMPAPYGLYQDTFQVQPGEMITFSLNGKKEHFRYWELPDTASDLITDPTVAISHIAQIFEECIKDQMVADVPLGAFLSGGVDSPLVCSYAQKYHSKLLVFSIGSDSVIHDESERAKAFAEAMNLEQKLWRMDAKEAVRYWSEATAALHEPLADFSILPTYLVSKLAKKNVTVALSGDGGDELFFGYERFWSIGKNINYQHYPSIIRKGIYGFDKYATGNRTVNSVLLSNSQSSAQEKLHSRFRKKWLDRIAPDLSNVSLPDDWNVYSYKNCKDKRDLLFKMRKAEFYGMMQKTLRKVDLASMENSLEVRVPFLQKKMIEASLQIDPLLSYGGGKQKQLLKRILNQNIPSVAEEKAKKGFGVPLTKWINADLKGEFQQKLLSNRIDDFGFEKKEIESMLKAQFNSSEDLKWPLFTLYALVK
jgi:asparagine synthase (glutamine-hydrolysing)